MDNEVKVKFKNEIGNLDNLEKYRDTLGQIYYYLTERTIGEKTKKLETKAKQMDKEAEKSNKNIEKASKNFNVAFNYKALATFKNSLKKLTQAMAENVNKSSSYYENLNLLEVAYKGNTLEADKFVNKLSEMYGLDESWGYRTVGLFKQLANAMGLANETGEKMSKTLTQLAIDTSSLYNINTDDAVSILTSALAGQTKPARRLGADITQATLQQTLINAGIDKSINKLTYAEKRLVIIASLLTQVKEATNDWGKTIESPANQTRIMSEQWERLTRAIGDIFLPIVYRALPYVNAILMVLTEIAKVIASLMGKLFNFDPKELDFGAGVTQTLDNITDGMDGATASTKNLKKELSGLRSFDQLININSPKNGSGSGSGGGAGTGVSADILDLANKAMDEYNKKIQDVEMKATKIRDKIMEWLGFTKVIDKETGKVSFKFDHITSGTILGSLAVGGAIFTGIMRIYSVLKKIGIVGTGSSTFISTIGKLGKILSGGSNLSPILSKLMSNLPLLALIIGEIQVLLTDKELHQIFKDIYKELKELYEIGKPLIDLFVSGLNTILSAVVQIIEQTWKLFIHVLEFMNEFTFEKILFGLQVITDLLKGDFSSVLDDVGKHFERTFGTFKKLLVGNSGSGGFFKDLQNSLTETEGTIQETLNSATNTSEGVDLLIGKLLTLVGTNGKVDKSNQAVAERIIKDINKALGTEYKLEDGVIKLKGEEIKSNKALEKSLEKVISQKKIEILLEGYKEDYIKALKEQKDAQEKINQLELDYYHAVTIGGKEGEASRKLITSELEIQRKKLNESQQQIKNYDDLIKVSASNNVKDMHKVLQSYGVETETSVTKGMKAVEQEAGRIKTTLNKNLGKFTINFDAKTENLVSKLSEAFKSVFSGKTGNTLKNYANLLLGTNFKANGGVFTGGKWQPIQRYDGGGTPATGQLFWARENGLPEMVGQIGGHTAVMNNDQIVGSVANGVYRAVKEANAQTSRKNTPQVLNFYLDRNNKLATYTLEQLQNMAKSNGKAITIS